MSDHQIDDLRSMLARLAVATDDLRIKIANQCNYIDELRSRLSAYECPDCGRIAARIEHSGHATICPQQRRSADAPG